MAIHFQINVKDAEKVATDLTRVAGQLVQGTDGVLDRAAEKAEVLMKSNAPKLTGVLSDSIDTQSTGENERTIGPTSKGHPGLSRYSPTHYAKYVEEGGGPTSRMPNIEDLAARFGVSVGAAIVIGKYLRDTGRAVRAPSLFVSKTADQIEDYFSGIAIKYVRNVVA